MDEAIGVYEDEAPLLARPNSDNVVIKSFKRRWWILAALSLTNYTQGLVWNTWSPIANNVTQWSTNNISTIHVTTRDIYLFSMWGPIGLMLFMPGFTYLLATKRLRLGIVLTAILLLLTGILRVVPANVYSDRLLLWHIAHFFNGIAGCATNCSGAYISSLWFNDEERGLATSISIAANWMGICCSFLFGPWIATDMDGLNDYLYLQLLFCLLVGISLLAYFPERPPLPPSYSTAFQQSSSFVEGIKTLCSRDCKDFWLMLVCYSVIGGIFGTWQSMCAMVFKQQLSEKSAGELGVATIIVGAVSSTLLGGVYSRLRGQIKLVLNIGYVIIMVMSGACILLQNGLIRQVWMQQLVIWSSSIVMGLVTVGASPLFFEQTCDCAFPADENIAGTFLGYSANVMGFICVLLPFCYHPKHGYHLDDDDDDPGVMTYALFIGAACSFIATSLCFTEQNRRLELAVSEETHSVLSVSSFSSRSDSTTSTASPAL